MRIVLVLAALALVIPSASAKIPPQPVQTAVVETGAAPCGMAVVGGELWVAVYETGEVVRIDREARITGRTRVGRWACRIAFDGRAAWVTRDRANRVVRVDRATGRRRAMTVSSPFDVVFAAGSIWVTSFDAGVVTRIDPATTRTTSTFDVGGNPTGITFCGGRIWVGHGRAATWLTAIDPRTGRLQRVDVVVPAPRWPRCIRGELWAATETAALRVVPRTGVLRGHFELGGTTAEAGPALGTATVWVTDKERSLVHRIDPGAGLVLDSFAAGPGALALTRFAGAVWITSFAGSDVRRFRP